MTYAPTPRHVAILALAALGLSGCGASFQIARTSPVTLPEAHVSAQYGDAGADAYSEFRSRRLGCNDLARSGWSRGDLTAVGCPPDGPFVAR